MKERERVGTGPHDAAAGTVTASGSRGGWRRWCLLLTATVASTFLLSLSASQAFGDFNQEDCMRIPNAQEYPDCSHNFPGSAVICWNGVVVLYAAAATQPCAPFPYSFTGTLSGAFPSPTTIASSYCPSGAVVQSIFRYRDPVNAYTRGVQVRCRHLTTGVLTNSPALVGSSSATSAASSCPSGQVIRGFYGRAGDVIDGFGVTCGVSTASTPTSGPYVGGFGGVAKGPFNCPAGKHLVGLQGTAAPYGGGNNVIRFEGSCMAVSGTLNSAPTAGPRLYRASGSQGPLTFSMVISKALEKPSSWHYGIEDLVVATGCSRSARVPGAAILVSDRRRVSQHPKFSARRGGFRIAGRVSGPLARPKVRATVTVLKGACRGEVLEFNAVKSR